MVPSASYVGSTWVKWLDDSDNEICREPPICLSQSLSSTPAIERTYVSLWIMRRAVFHMSGWLGFWLKGWWAALFLRFPISPGDPQGTHLLGSLPLRVNGFLSASAPWPQGQPLQPWAILLLGIWLRGLCPVISSQPQLQIEKGSPRSRRKVYVCLYAVSAQSYLIQTTALHNQSYYGNKISIHTRESVLLRDAYVWRPMAADALSCVFSRCLSIYIFPNISFLEI